MRHLAAWGSRRARRRGMTTIELAMYMAVGAVVISGITMAVIFITDEQRDAAAESVQMSAVGFALDEIVEAVDESASIFHATETELGIGRNVTAAGGGIDCRIDQFWVDTSADPVELMQWSTQLTGSCVDVPSWTPVNTLTGFSAMVSDVEPYTLVDDEGIATAACTGTATSSERGEDGYCVPLFRYLDTTGNEFAPTTPVAKHSISAVHVVLSASFAHDVVPVSRAVVVSPNAYQPGNQIQEIAAPSCPSGLTRTVSGSSVTLEWPPVPNATSYRVVRSYDGATTTVATLTVAAMAADAAPSYVDDITGLAATSIVYQVLPTVAAEEATGCPQAIVSIQAEAPDVSVEILGSSDATWLGARSSDSGLSVWPTLRASWPAVPGATGYEAEMREMDPGDDSAPLSGWASFDWDGSTPATNAVTGPEATTNMWDGSRLFSRAFQVRVRTVSQTGSSPWTYCYMEPGDDAAGSCGTFPGNSFPSSGLNGYLVMPAPGQIQVDDVARVPGPGSVDLTWNDSPDWSAPQYNRDTIFYRVNTLATDGDVDELDYTSPSWAIAIDHSDGTTGSGDIDAGDWAHFTVQRCNSINPYSWGAGSLGVPYTGSGLVQCSPSSRAWSALAVPDVPEVTAAVNSSANTNEARWGQHAATTTADYSGQRIDTYDVAQEQGGGAGTTAASGNTSSAQDEILDASKAAPWQDDVAVTSATHSRREGDFTRYAAAACNVAVNTAATSSWLAGVTGEAGVGEGVESCSDWSDDTDRFWQKLGAPTCSAWDDWNTIRIDAQFDHLYVSPIDTVASRRVVRYNDSEGVSWTRTVAGAAMGDLSYTWNDDGSSSNSSEGTVRPESYFRAGAGVSSVYVGETYLVCDSGRVDYPPVPQTPYANVSLDHVNSSGRPYVRYAWDGDDSPVASNYVRRSVNGGSWSTVSNSGSWTDSSYWGSSHSIAVRAAYSSRLFGWGYYSGNSDSLSPNVGSYGGCPRPNYAAFAASWGDVSYISGSPAVYGDGCSLTLRAGNAYDDGLLGFYREQVDTDCADAAASGSVPYYCATNDRRNTEASSRRSASSFTRSGDLLGVLKWDPDANAGTNYTVQISWPSVNYPTWSGRPFSATRPSSVSAGNPFCSSVPCFG